MGSPNSSITFGIPRPRANGRYYSLDWHGNPPGGGNASGAGITVNATPPTGTASGSGGNMGTLGSYSELDLSAASPFTIRVEDQDYAMHFNGANGGAGTGSSTHNASGWPGGGAFIRIRPPTVDGLERGVALNNLYRNATLGIQDFNLRFKLRMGPALASLLWSDANSGPKFCIIHCRRTLTEGNNDDRPMFFLTRMNTADNPIYNRNNTFVMAPGQGTVQGWGSAEYAEGAPELTFYPNGPQRGYYTDEGDTGTFQGFPLMPVSDVFTVEYRVLTDNIGGYTRGLIAQRIYHGGTYFERGIPYDRSAAVPLGGFVQEVQQFGCGEWNNAPPEDPDMYFDIGPRITVARNFGGWLGDF